MYQRVKQWIPEDRNPRVEMVREIMLAQAAAACEADRRNYDKSRSVPTVVQPSMVERHTQGVSNGEA